MKSRNFSQHLISRGLSLDQLLKRGSVVLDTCALLSPLDGIPFTKKRTSQYCCCDAESTDFFKRILEQNGRELFVTEIVVEEYLDHSVNSDIKKESLVGAFRNRGKVLSCRNKGIFAYDVLYGMYYSLLDGKGVNEVDYDLIISSAVLSIRRNVSVVSNDFDLLSILNKISRNKLVGFPDLAGFQRTHFDKFERFYH